MQTAPGQYTYVAFMRNGRRPIDLGRYTSDLENLWLGFKTSPGAGGDPEYLEANRDSYIQRLRELLGERNELLGKGLYEGIVLAIDTDKGEAVGFGSLFKHDSSTLEYAAAYVKPEDRGRGVFGKITERIIEKAKLRGRVLEGTLVSFELPEASLTKRGFERVGHSSRFSRRLL